VTISILGFLRGLVGGKADYPMISTAFVESDINKILDAGFHPFNRSKHALKAETGFYPLVI